MFGKLINVSSLVHVLRSWVTLMCCDRYSECWYTGCVLEAFNAIPILGSPGGFEGSKISADDNGVCSAANSLPCSVEFCRSQYSQTQQRLTVRLTNTEGILGVKMKSEPDTSWIDSLVDICSRALRPLGGTPF